jgi:hypothetical protein
MGTLIDCSETSYERAVLANSTAQRPSKTHTAAFHLRDAGNSSMPVSPLLPDATNALTEVHICSSGALDIASHERNNLPNAVAAKTFTRQQLCIRSHSRDSFPLRTPASDRKRTLHHGAAI